MPKCQNAKMPKCQNAKMRKCQNAIGIFGKVIHPPLYGLGQIDYL